MMVSRIIKIAACVVFAAYVVMLWLSVALSMDDLYCADELEDWT